MLIGKAKRSTWVGSFGETLIDRNNAPLLFSSGTIFPSKYIMASSLAISKYNE
ncbi:hypothetical protein [Acidiplasma cupricumulans]|uniref:hypothetical protein n=1 Tax=Acidiplasma cupricumulans TaxID=312540 RepID=UPI001584AE95|nr:hypothetical protein [Acidiplasma cupricumulans]